MTAALEDIISTLESLGELQWVDRNKKREKIILSNPKGKSLVRLLVYAAHNKLDAESGSPREKLASEESLYAQLDSAWQVEPSEPQPYKDASRSPPGPPNTWYLSEVKTTGFGGLNGPDDNQGFSLKISDSSTCFLGGNGSGKTSLISAIAWALTGQRISDASGLTDRANDLSPVFDPDDPSKQIAEWAPIATYPSSRWGYAKEAAVSVSLIFNRAGCNEKAALTRSWSSATAPDTALEIDERLKHVKSCFDIAVEMPLRMAHLKFGEDGTLNDAISALTGLDVLVTVAEVVASLKRRDGKFLNTPKEAEHEARAQSIKKFLAEASASATVANSLEDFANLECWIEKSDEFSEGLDKLASNLIASAGRDLITLQKYVSKTLDLTKEDDQKKLNASVSAAVSGYEKDHLNRQFSITCPTLSAMGKIAKQSHIYAEKLQTDHGAALNSLVAAVELHKMKLADNRLALKAIAGETHQKRHGGAPIAECPLCDRALDSQPLLELAQEISALAHQAEAISQTLQNAARLIAAKAEKTLTDTVAMTARGCLDLKPCEIAEAELRNLLVNSHAFTTNIPAFSRLFDEAMAKARNASIPPFEYVSPPIPISLTVDPETRSALAEAWEVICALEKAAELSNWSASGVTSFRDFYSETLGKPECEPDVPSTALRALAAEMDNYLLQVKPAQQAATALRSAKQLGLTWLRDAKLKKHRAKLVEAVEPLRFLPKFVSAKIDEQLDELSDKISGIVDRFHLGTGFSFAGTRLEKEGRQRRSFLRARAAPKTANQDKTAIPNGYQVDAGQIANTSWMRALLWAFILALREKRIEELGGLPLPLILMDDPQATFDIEHRCAWTEFVLGTEPINSISKPAQIIFTTYDRTFAHHLNLYHPGFPIRQMVGPPGPDGVAVVNGSQMVDEFWDVAKISKTNRASTEAIGKLRRHIELLFKVVFPPAMGGTETTLGKLMSQFAGVLKQGGFPYQGGEFPKLVKAWNDPAKEKYRIALSEPHHSDDSPYDFNFAKNVFAWWSGDLEASLQGAFEAVVRIREAGWRMPHLNLSVPSKLERWMSGGGPISLPANMNDVIGRVAAETDGREVTIINDQPALRFIEQSLRSSEIEPLEVVCLTAATLEPTAHIGDALLLSESLPATQNSLVVCHAEGAARARRYSELPGSSANVALVASSTNPRQISRTILVEKAPQKFKKVVGIIFNHGWKVPAGGEAEISTFAESGIIETFLSKAAGRATVIGSSAEPVALHDQSLILGKRVLSKRELTAYSNKPIVVVREGRALFKRLRFSHETHTLVLESIEAGGRHPPIVIPEEELQTIDENLVFRPVFGVLFDPPSLKK